MRPKQLVAQSLMGKLHQSNKTDEFCGRKINIRGTLCPRWV